MQVTFTRIQQSNIKAKFVAKQNPDIQVQGKLLGKECWLREVPRLMIATIDETRKTILEIKKWLGWMSHLF